MWDSAYKVAMCVFATLVTIAYLMQSQFNEDVQSAIVAQGNLTHQIMDVLHTALGRDLNK